MSTRTRFQGAGCALSAVEFGDPEGDELVLIHGIRDHAMSLSEIARGFPEHRVVAMDLRGHGESEHAGSYTLVELVADLVRLVDFYELRAPILVGHSLGGHVAMRFAALYPDRVRALVLLDGLGPPRHPKFDSVEGRLERWRAHVASALEPGAHRVMADETEARERLMRSNPRLSEKLARVIVRYGTDPRGDGLVWNWDPRAHLVFSTLDREGEGLYPEIECPVLIVSGEDSMAYWLRTEAISGEVRSFHRAEVERRRRLFRDAAHVELARAGHMLHYDAPAEVIEVLRSFANGLTDAPATPRAQTP